MWYIVIAAILVISFISGCKYKLSSNKNDYNTMKEEKNIDSSMVIDSSAAMYSREDIEKKLVELKNAPVPQVIPFGAMCYVPSGPPQSYNYICPICNEKTLYKNDPEIDNWEVMRDVSRNIKACRIEIEQISGINVILDESQFCKHCSPNTEQPKMILRINLANSSDTTMIINPSKWDIRLIAEFLSGKTIHSGSRDVESPLIDHIDRIQELLGVQLKDEEND